MKHYSITVRLSTRNFGTTKADFSEPSVFTYYNHCLYGNFTAGAATSWVTYNEPFIDDITDGAGHGYLVGTDKIYAQITSSNTGAVNSASVKVYYRWKNVSLTEYIGMVQSQQ